ncbi:MAG: homoserine O-succinyltransferase [Steroidobacteraceae bacterium]
MSLEVEAHPAGDTRARSSAARRWIRIAVVNNMPDTALAATETQFCGLLQAAAGGQQIRVRFTSFPELPRSPAALEHIGRSYWPFDELLSEPLDALIVTGTEPRTPRLADEPYWPRFPQLLAWAEAQRIPSIWSCLAAHAVVEYLDGIERQRLAHKRCGVFEHEILDGDPLLGDVGAPLPMPHSRWNELPVTALRAAGYTLLSWSAHTGADAFIRRRRSPMLFFQGHPEYEAATLLKEYRRDVGRYLDAQQPQYPTLPHGYFSATATALLEEFRQRALTSRTAGLLQQFPFEAVAAALRNTWRPAAVAIYRNWLTLVGAAGMRMSSPDAVSLIDL